MTNRFSTGSVSGSWALGGCQHTTLAASKCSLSSTDVGVEVTLTLWNDNSLPY